MDGQEQKQEQQPQRQKRGYTDRANQVYENAKRVGKTYRRLRKVGAAVRVARVGTVLVSTVEVWGPILLLILGVVFFVIIVTMVVSVLTGGPQVEGGEQPAACSTVEGSLCKSAGTNCTTLNPPMELDQTGLTCGPNLVCCVPTAGSVVTDPNTPPVAGNKITCSPGKYIQTLKDVFDINLQNATSYEQEMMCKSFAYAAKAPNYLKILKSGGGTLTIRMHQGSGCWGLTVSSTLIKTGVCTGIPFKNFAHWIIHESGHVIADRHPYLKSSFPLSKLKSSSGDPSCYDSYGFMESYPLSGSCSVGRRITPLSESFAEALSYYTTWMYSYSPWECARPFSNFKTQCDNTYAWEKGNIYDGYEFH